MTDAPKTAVSGILVVIVIFVVLLVFFALMGDSSSQITDIFNEVFFGEQTATEEAKQNTVAAEKDLLEQVGKCQYDEKVNPESASNCFCSTSSFGVVSNDQYLSIHNGKSTLTVTAYDTGDAPLYTQQESYELGLFAVQITDTGEQLGCIFPEQYFIKGLDDEVKETQWSPSYAATNNWYVIWKDERANKAGSESGDDYTFGFYRDKQTIGTEDDYSYGYYLRAAPQLYKISDTQYCLLTDLIEHRLTDVSNLGYNQVYTLTDEQASKSAPFVDFLADSSKYCNKDSSSTTPINTFAPSGTFYWLSQATGESGESTTLFGTRWNGGYICGVDAFSFTVLFDDLTPETKAKIREVYNSNTNTVQMSDSGVIDATYEQGAEIIAEKEEYQLNPACTFRIADFNADSYPFLEIKCPAQYATGSSTTTCNNLVEGQMYFQNLAPAEIENTIPDLNNNGFDPNVYYVSE